MLLKSLVKSKVHCIFNRKDEWLTLSHPVNFAFLRDSLIYNKIFLGPILYDSHSCAFSEPSPLWWVACCFTLGSLRYALANA